MSKLRIALRCLPLLAGAALYLFGAQPADLNPKALAYKLPNQLEYHETSSGAMEAVLYGDPKKAGWYIIMVKWLPHRMSHPHFHPNDRYAVVVSGTWWVGTGTKFSPDTTTPLPPGSVVTHFGKQVHYDGAKDQEVLLQISGMGPDTATNAEQK